MRQNLVNGESTHEYYAEISHLYGILETLGKNVTVKKRRMNWPMVHEESAWENVPWFCTTSPLDLLLESSKLLFS